VIERTKAVVASAERERERNERVCITRTHKKIRSKILFKNVFKNVSKNSHHLSFLYTRRERKKEEQTRVPVPAALELRRAVVAKVEAHYLLRMRRGVVLFLLSDDLLSLRFEFFFSFIGIGLQQQKNVSTHPSTRE